MTSSRAHRHSGSGNCQDRPPDHQGGPSYCLMKERRTALISAAVTGKIDVRDAA